MERIQTNKPKKLPHKKIIVIGGGAASISLVAHFLDRLISSSMRESHQFEITLFEKNRRIGPGLA